MTSNIHKTIEVYSVILCIFLKEKKKHLDHIVVIASILIETNINKHKKPVF